MKPIRTAALILTVLTLAVIVSIGRVIAQDMRAKDRQQCVLYADMAIVAASFAGRVDSHASLWGGIAPIYAGYSLAPAVASRIVSRAWTGRPDAVPWGHALLRACEAGRGDLNAFLAEPT
jgi:hypothetical protein